MCGFVAAISKTDKPFPENVLRQMTSMISHRGPDDEGFLFHENWLAFGFRRLSIIDLSVKGHQPMFSDNKHYAIVYNGEVYNYLEIREELIAKGVNFNSSTDTEVVLKAYIEYGPKCLQKFTGMFAFIIVDLKNKTAFIAKDHLGIKPLFYYETNQFYLFFSEIKSLLPYVSLEFNADVLKELLVFRNTVGRETPFEKVYNLEPGSYLIYEKNSLSHQQYFNLVSTFTNQNKKISFIEACKIVEQELKKSIKLHLRSDVEVGVQLSGGVDSSLITAIASELTSKQMHSFSISFDEQEYDESKYQKNVSEKYRTIHHNFLLDDNYFTNLLEKTIWTFEFPLSDPNIVGTYYLTEMAKKYLKVMLAGEGADESFLGYARFNRDQIVNRKIRFFFHKHKKLRKFLEKIWPIEKGKTFLSICKYDPAMYMLTYAKLPYVDELLNGNDSIMTFRHNVSLSAQGDMLKAAILHDQICDLNQWFVRADRMSMASSIEMRVPFATKDMFALANSIPYSIRVYKGERKAILKKIAEKYIDNEQIYRKKIGFGTPIDQWLKNKKSPLSELFYNTISSNKFKSREFINHNHFNSIYQRYLNNQYVERNVSFLWMYFNIELWYRIYFEGEWKKFVNLK